MPTGKRTPCQMDENKIKFQYGKVRLPIKSQVNKSKISVNCRNAFQVS